MYMQYCHSCELFLPFIEDVCPKCNNSSHIPNNTENYFLSGDYEPSSKEMHFSPGDILNNRFKINENLGRTSSVYSVEDLLRGVNVAIKIIFEGPPQALSEQLKKIPVFDSAMKLSGHPHIIKIYDFHEVCFQDRHFIIQSMEYGSSGNYRDFLMMMKSDRQARMTTGLTWFFQICKGVEALHSKGVLHLDVRPENLLFIDGSLKVIDIGVLQYILAFNNVGNFVDNEIVHKISSPIYMSPELFQAQRINEIDHRSDIYSLGIILYELCHPTGLPPFSGSYENLRNAHIRSPLPELTDIDSPMWAVIECCLKKSPNDRFADIRSLLAALNEIETEPGQKESAPAEELCPGEAKEKVSETFEKAQELYDQNKINEAHDILECLAPGCPPETNILRRKIRVNYENAEKIYSDINDSLGNGNLRHLVKLVQEACEVYPDHPLGGSIQLKLLSMAKAYNESIDAGNAFLGNSDWEGALYSFNQALAFEKNEPSIKRIVAILTKITNWRVDIDKALENENFDKARTLACLVDDLAERLNRDE